MARMGWVGRVVLGSRGGWYERRLREALAGVEAMLFDVNATHLLDLAAQL